MATPADSVKHRNYPPLDFKVGCTCPACELAILLWFTEDEHPARAAWQVFWDRIYANTNDWPATMEGRPCLWQFMAWSEVEPRPKPTAYRVGPDLKF